MDSDDSSSPSTSESSVNCESCQVCGGSAHGNHFGAFVCRACAAFFRRAILGQYSGLSCRSRHGDCAAFKNGRFYCKKCRLKKCSDAGMDPDRFQFDHDLISTTNLFEKSKKRRSEDIPPTMTSFLGRPHCIITFEPELASSIKTMIDLRFLIDKASNVLDDGMPTVSNLSGLNMLEKMTLGLKNVRQPKENKSQFLKKIGKSETFALWEEDFLMVAKWLAYCDEYQKLGQSMKLKILKCVWQLWIRLETIVKTAEMRSTKKCEEGLIMLTNEVSFNFEEIEVDVSWFSNYSQVQLKEFLEPTETEFIEDIIVLLMKLRPTPIEQTFMLTQICFQYAGKLFQGSVLKTSEKMQEEISNELHNYYINEMILPNYGGRLTQMMKINHIVEKDMTRKMEKKEIGRIFDTFTIDFTHPEVFLMR